MKTREELLMRGEGVATAMSLEKVRELRGRVEDYMKLLFQLKAEVLTFWKREGIRQFAGTPPREDFDSLVSVLQGVTWTLLEQEALLEEGGKA